MVECKWDNKELGYQVIYEIWAPSKRSALSVNAVKSKDTCLNCLSPAIE